MSGRRAGHRNCSRLATTFALLAVLALAGCGGGGGGEEGKEDSDSDSDVNTSPVVNNLRVSTAEDTALEVTMTGSDSDGDELTFSITRAPLHGTLGAIAPLSPTAAKVTYTPDADIDGSDSFEFRVDDGAGGSALAIAQITIDPVPDPARAVDDAVATDEDTPVAFTVLDNDLDPDVSETISFASTDAAGITGILTDNGDGSYAFDPAGAFEDLAAGETRTTTFTYSIDSSDGSSDDATVTITVTGLNDLPSVEDDRFGATNLLVNGDFESGDFAGWTADSTVDPATGSFFIDDDTASPVTSFTTVGPAAGSFYAVSDLSVVSALSLAQSFTAPDLPSTVLAFDMFITTVPDGQEVINPAGLVTDAGTNQHVRVDLLEAAAATYETGIGVVRNAFIGIGPPGALPRPYENYAYDLSLDLTAGQEYRLRYAQVQTIAVMNVGVDNVRVSTGTDEETTIDLPAPGVLGNDSDPDGSDVLTVTAFDALSAQGATVNVNADGSYTYDPSTSAALSALELGEALIDTFGYTVDDGNGGMQSASVEIVVNGLTDNPPVADDQAVATAEDTPVDIVLTGNDPEGNPLSFSITAPPVNGTLGAITPINATSASVTYTPAADTNGPDSFEFQVDDGALTDTATVSIDVTPENDPPSALLLDNLTINENQPAGSPVGLFTTTDIDSTAFTYTLVAGAGDSGNAAFAIAGDSLQSAAPFDFETQPTSYSVRVRTDDGAGGQLEQVFTITVADINDPPSAVNETFGVGIGNTLLAVGVAIAGEPVVALAGSVLDNDVDQDGNALSVSSVGALVSANGGTVEMNTDGTFTYLPPTGFTGTDTFVYTVSDSLLGADAVASITVADMVWYFDSTAAGGDGRSRAPLTSLPGAAVIGAPGDTLFVYAGTQTSGATLANGQRLLGEGVGLVVNATALVAPGTRPVIANAAGPAVTLAQNNTVRGLSINSQAGIVGNNAGDMIVGSVSVVTTNGPAIDIANSNLVEILLDSVTATNTATGGEGIRLVNNNGGSLTVNGPVQLQVPLGLALQIDNAGILGSVFNFGATVLAGQRGMLLLNNPGAEFTFASLDIDATLGAGLDARNTGILTIEGVTNTVDVANAGAGGFGLRIENTTLGDPGNGTVTFRSISSTGGSGGILLDDTFDLARFVVTGVGAGAGSGGLLQNATGNGIELNNVAGGVSFSNIEVRDNLGNGIRGNVVDGLTLAGSVIENNTDTTPVDEAGLLFDQLTGTVQITDTTIGGSTRGNIVIRNTTGTLDLTATDARIENNSAANGEDGLYVQAAGTATTNLTLNNVTFVGNRGDDLQASSLGTATLDLELTGGSMTGAAGKLGSGINLTGDANLDFMIDSVDVDGAGTSAININMASTSLAGDLFSGTVRNTTIGIAGDADSGSATGSGLRAIANGNGTLNVTITDNTIRQYNDNGIEIIARDGNGTLNATITSNIVTEPAQFAADGLLVQAGATGTDTGRLCAVIGSANLALQNMLTGAGGTFDDDFRVRQRFGTTVNLPGYAGANNDIAAVVTFVQGNNDGTPTGSATEDVPVGGGGFTGVGTTCP